MSQHPKSGDHAPPAAEAPAVETLAERARGGHAPSLEALVLAINDQIYGMALRMLWHPEDAEDAAQEILMKVVTHLGTWRRESAFRTWVYRIATNHLLTVRQSRVEREGLTYAAMGAQLAAGLSDPPASSASDPDHRLLEEEVKIGCTMAMLLCLDREHRIAYILGDVFECRSEDGGYILGIEPATFRKRLSRARERLRSFMRGHCGLVNSESSCRCARRVEYAVSSGRVDPDHLLFARETPAGSRPLPILEQVGEMEELHQIAGIYQSHPAYAAPGRVIQGIKDLLRSDRFSLLQ